MKFVTVKKEKTTFVGVLVANEERVLNLQKVAELQGEGVKEFASLISCIEKGERFVEEVQEMMGWAVGNDEVYESLDDVQLLAPIPRPLKNIFCVGKNYAAHAIEMGSEADIPKAPMLFSKAPTAVTGPNAVVLHHQHVTEQLDYEGELAVVIGKKGKGIAKEAAMDFVFGYTIINDITARDLQARHKQFLLGKSMDTSCPMGPAIVHKSLVEDPHNLTIQTRVNGEVRQHANTEQFIFDIPTLISTISQATTLEAGDIIATGTPSGVGKGFNPPKYLQPGDVVEVEIGQLGILRNTIEV